jgi:hypothetical protein
MAPNLQHFLPLYRTIQTNWRIIIMADDNDTGSNLIWAVATIIIVAIIALAIYSSGMLNQKKTQDIDVEIKAPAASR